MSHLSEDVVSRTTSLVAREHELDRALHSLRFSGGVLITGEAGAGKTFLAARVADQLPHPPVAWLMATTASRATPLGALTGLLPPDLATIHPALVAQHVNTRLRELSRAEARPATGPGPAARAAAVAPTRRTAPPVLVVDDAQLLDPQSAAVLLSLVSAKSVRLLGTMRAGETPSDAVTALWKEQVVDRLDLDPLDRTASRDAARVAARWTGRLGHRGEAVAEQQRQPLLPDRAGPVRRRARSAGGPGRSVVVDRQRGDAAPAR